MVWSCSCTFWSSIDATYHRSPMQPYTGWTGEMIGDDDRLRHISKKLRLFLLFARCKSLNVDWYQHQGYLEKLRSLHSLSVVSWWNAGCFQNTCEGRCIKLASCCPYRKYLPLHTCTIAIWNKALLLNLPSASYKPKLTRVTWVTRRGSVATPC